MDNVKLKTLLRSVLVGIAEIIKSDIEETRQSEQLKLSPANKAITTKETGG